MRVIGYRVTELAESQRVSTLGAEAVAAAEHLAGPLCVWDGDDCPGTDVAAQTTGIAYRIVARWATVRSPVRPCCPGRGVPANQAQEIASRP